MTRTKDRTLDYYVERIQKHLLKKYPHLRFQVERWSDREATIYYTPYSEEEDWQIIHRVGGIATDALVDANIRIWVMPDRVGAAAQTSQ
jgi:hypothetical protein